MVSGEGEELQMNDSVVEQTRERLSRYNNSYLLRSQAERDHADSEEMYYKAVLSAFLALAQVQSLVDHPLTLPEPDGHGRYVSAHVVRVERLQRILKELTHAQ